MVRLKYIPALEVRSIWRRSQFHYGSIEMQYSIEDCLTGIGVSIPLWFDWNSNWANITRLRIGGLNSIMVRLKYKLLKLSQYNEAQVSIPLWFDWNQYSIEDCLTGIGVSIPLWFDWNNMQDAEFREAYYESQFHYGSIEIEQNVFDQLPMIESQFHYGSIEMK